MERPVDRGPIHWNSHGAETGRAPRTYLNALTQGFPPPARSSSTLLLGAPAPAPASASLSAPRLPRFLFSRFCSPGA